MLRMKFIIFSLLIGSFLPLTFCQGQAKIQPVKVSEEFFNQIFFRRWDGGVAGFSTSSKTTRCPGVSINLATDKVAVIAKYYLENQRGTKYDWYMCGKCIAFMQDDIRREYKIVAKWWDEVISREGDGVAGNYQERLTGDGVEYLNYRATGDVYLSEPAFIESILPIVKNTNTVYKAAKEFNTEPPADYWKTTRVRINEWWIVDCNDKTAPPQPPVPKDFAAALLIGAQIFQQNCQRVTCKFDKDYFCGYDTMASPALSVVNMVTSDGTGNYLGTQEGKYAAFAQLLKPTDKAYLSVSLIKPGIPNARVRFYYNGQSGSTLTVCCTSETVSTCPISAQGVLGSTAKNWRLAEFTCPSGTTGISFLIKNSRTSGATIMGIDNIAMYQATKEEVYCTALEKSQGTAATGQQG